MVSFEIMDDNCAYHFKEVVNMCKAWDDHKKRGIQEGRYLEIYSLVHDGIIEPELGAKRLNMTFADFERAMQKAGYKL